MEIGTLLIRVTIWAALAGYAGGALLQLLGKGRDGAARGWWTAGCAAYLAHVVAAFHFFYGWSHGTGIAETERQTLEMTGMRWGGGL